MTDHLEPLGMNIIRDATGELPVYPGHALSIAYEIIHVFANLDEALERTNSDTQCVRAAADGRISGGGGEVYLACQLLKRARDGEPIDKLMDWADERWVSSRAGGHTENVEAGLAQAVKLKAAFPGAVAAWLAV